MSKHRVLLKSLLPVAAAILLHSDVDAQPSQKRSVRYGANPVAGKTFTHDGVQLYYEVYGAGEPVLLIHGNGGRITDLTAQIDYFRRNYRVIAMDSRDHGNSADSSEYLTYEKMTDDLAALLEHLKSPPVLVLGWSDGGIEGLLLGIRHPDKVKKIAAMAANLYPEGLHPEATDLIKAMLGGVKPEERATKEGRRELKVTQMLLDEPHIEPRMLEAILAPTLVLASDHDMILDEHTLEIFHRIPNSQLCIFPDATHMTPYDGPKRFNSTVDRFFRATFVPKDRIKDLMKSYEALKASQH